MFCPECGNQVPDGTKFCPSCGNAFGDASAPAPAGGAAQPAAPQGVAYTPVAPAAPAKGANKGLIIGLAVVAVAIVAAIVFGLVSCMGGTNYVGTWEGSATIEEYAGMDFDCTLKLNDDDSAVFESELLDGSIDTEWREGDNGVEVEIDGTWETFEKDGDTLVFEDDGVTVELEKK